MNENNVNNINPGVQVAPTVSGTTTPTPPPSVGGGTSSSASKQLLCDKCGTYYPSNQRYCMKCGALNYSHPDNQSMKQYMNYDVVNHNYVENFNSKLSHQTIDPAVKVQQNIIVGNVVINFLLPVVLTILSIAGVFYVPMSSLIGLFVIFFILFIYNYSMCLLFDRAGETWWTHFIPFYGLMVYFRVSMFSMWYFLLCLIPITLIIILPISVYKLGTRFGKNGWLTLFFSWFMIPYMALSGASYSGSLKSMHMALCANDLDAKGRTQSEKSYGAKKNFIIIVVFIVLAVCCYLFRDLLMEWGSKIYNFLIECFNEFVELYNKYN